MLMQSMHGLSGLALCSLLGDKAFGERLVNDDSKGESSQPHLAPKETHFAAKAKHVVFLYMDGGPSQVDTFDPKPALDKYNGRNPHEVFKVEPTQFNNIGKVLASPWKFKKQGASGLDVSDLFPHIATCADDLTVIRSMIAPFSEHTNGNYFLHTCVGVQGRPSHGAWVVYGLGSECQNLPGYIVLNGGLTPPGGLDNFGSGFLPAAYQGSVFRPGPVPVANIKPQEARPELQQAKLDLIRRLDNSVLARLGKIDKLESAIANYELAARMQTAVPDLMDLSDETAKTKQMYGLESTFKNTQTYGRLCLITRRLIEKGVRFIELTCTRGNGDRWDQHGGLKQGHEKNAKSVDQPIAALIKDLKQRDLLKDTLLVFCGEFGRTPFAQGRNGRDHNPFGFTIWMCGGGAKPGTIYGATDEFGYHSIENKVEIYDLHATMLHLLGMDHTRLTYRWGGRDMRLTDVHGHVIKDVIA